MNDNLEAGELVRRCRMFEQVIALLVEHVHPRPTSSQRLALRVMHTIAARAEAEDLPPATLAVLRRATRALAAGARSRIGSVLVSPLAPVLLAVAA